MPNFCQKQQNNPYINNPFVRFFFRKNCLLGITLVNAPLGAKGSPEFSQWNGEEGEEEG